MKAKTINTLLIIFAILLFISIYISLGLTPLIISTIIAFIALKIVRWFGIRIPIDIWSILILLAGGILGLLIMILLNITGIAFRGKRR